MSSPQPYRTFVKAFEVEITHDYHLKTYLFDNQGNRTEDTQAASELDLQYNLHREMIVRPTQETAALMDTKRMQFRTTPKGFFVFLPVALGSGSTPPFQPLYPFSQTDHFRFELLLRNPQWLNYTDLLPQGFGADQFYYFENDKGSSLQLSDDPVFSTATLDSPEIRDRSDFNAQPDVYGLIDVFAYQTPGNAGNIIENGTLNITSSPQGPVHPVFTLRFASRPTVWKYVNTAGVEVARTSVPVPYSRIGIRNLPISGQNQPEDWPNPNPKNLKWDPGGNTYVSEVYL